MPNPFFQFKKFTVYHDKCAMKVGTDGVLLGAWASVENARRILDIGTGTGLIALMLAQRSDASVVGVDIDEAAVEQARENIERSEWKNRIVVEHKDVRDLSGEKYSLFDVIVSNPPYFTEAVYCPDKQRNTARHMDSLPFDELLQAVDRLLAACRRGMLFGDSSVGGCPGLYSECTSLSVVSVPADFCAYQA